MGEGGGSKEKLHPSITCIDGAGGFCFVVFVLFCFGFVFVTETHPGVKSDILAIKTIRFLFALPIKEKESMFLREARGRQGVGRVPLRMV